MASVTLKRRPTVTIDPSLEHECSICGKSKPRTSEHFHTRGRGANTLVNICKVCQSARDSVQKAGRIHGKALTLIDPRSVVFDDLSTSASVGWYGDVEYFPITPLLGLTRFTSEVGLLSAIREDVLLSTKPRLFLVRYSQDKQNRAVWHLPWSYFNSFILKYGSTQTKPQQDRVQRVIEMAFGHTAESNRIAVEQIDQEPIVTQQSDSTAAVDQIKNGVLSLFGPAIEMLVLTAVSRAISEYKGTTPDEDKEILDNTRAVREGVSGVMIKEVPGPTIIDEWMKTGGCYLAVERRKGLMSVGKVLGEKTPDQRMKDSDYNGNKSDDNHWEVAWWFQTDRPGGTKKEPGAEEVLIGYVARMGVEQLTAGGRFRYDTRVEEQFKQLPAKLKFANLHRWIEKAGLFPEILFAYVHST